MQFEHIGIVTDQKKPGESFVPATRVWRTNYLEHPYRIEWLRFEPDSAVPDPVKKQPHVAYRVDDLAAAGRGLQVLLKPFDVGPRIVAFFQTPDGAVVELIQYKPDNPTDSSDPQS